MLESDLEDSIYKVIKPHNAPPRDSETDVTNLDPDTEDHLDQFPSPPDSDTMLPYLLDPLHIQEVGSSVGSLETRVDRMWRNDLTEAGKSQLDEPDGETFAERQMDHFSKVLGEKWACPEEGHNICVPTEDGRHYQLSDENIMTWVDALCRGETTTSQPPDEVFASINSDSTSDGSSTIRGSRTTIRAVSIAPSRRYGSLHSPGVSSFNSSFAPTERSVWSPYSSFLPSLSEESPPPKFGGRTIKWLGEKSLGTLQGAVIGNRANAHLSRLKKWKKRAKPKLGPEEREKVLEMLADALELSRPCYPPRINKLAYSIGREVQQWLHSYPDLPQTRENSLLIIQVQTCLIPIVLTRISRDDPLAGDLAWEIIDELTRIPLAVQEVDTAAIVIRLVARELAYSKCASQHSWLGVDLLRIVEMTLQIRPLTDEEQVAIWELAVRRKQQSQDTLDTSRPWEVALFALCAPQNTWFKDAVLGENGLQSLITALDSMLSIDIPVEAVNWEDVALTLRALAFLSEHRWVASAVEPEIVASLLGVFRRSIPERWFCIRFWAMDTTRNIVSHRPPLVSTLVKENAAIAFASLTTITPASNSRNNSRGGAVTSRLLEDYKKEASKRAEELSTYIKNWKEWAPYLVKLEPVSITGTF